MRPHLVLALLSLSAVVTPAHAEFTLKDLTEVYTPWPPGPRTTTMTLKFTEAFDPTIHSFGIYVRSQAIDRPLLAIDDPEFSITSEGFDSTGGVMLAYFKTLDRPPNHPVGILPAVVGDGGRSISFTLNLDDPIPGWPRNLRISPFAPYAVGTFTNGVLTLPTDGSIPVGALGIGLVVPEPSTFALCGTAALLGLLGWRLHRRAA